MSVYVQKGVRTVASTARNVTAAVAATALAALAARAAVSLRERQTRSAVLLRCSAGLAPVPPALPPGRVMALPGRGEVFVRDSGGTSSRPAVLLLHGWTASADLNFFPVYAGLSDSYRVIALDLRGHGR